MGRFQKKGHFDAEGFALRHSSEARQIAPTV
jgi:hypothetical protein